MLGSYYVTPRPAKVKPAWASALKKRREAVVGSQEDLAVRADISQSLVSQMERGVQNPLGLSLERLSRLLEALSWSVGEFSAATGLALPLALPADDLSGGRGTWGRALELPESLEQMIEEKKHLDDWLLEPRWQQYLAQQRFSTGSATPQQYWNLFLLMKNAGLEPGGN